MFKFIIDGEGSRKKFESDSFKSIEWEWTYRSVDAQDATARCGGYNKTWVSIFEDDTLIFKGRFDLVGKFEEKSFYYYLSEQIVNHYKDTNNNNLLKVLSILYSMKNNCEYSDVKHNVITCEDKILAIITDREEIENMTQILERWQVGNTNKVINIVKSVN